MGMHIDMCTDMCIHRCLDICMDMCKDMCFDMRIDQLRQNNCMAVALVFPVGMLRDRKKLQFKS